MPKQSEQNESTFLQKQEKIKPKIEDVVGDFLDAEKTSAILNFIGFIRADKIGIQHASGKSWNLTYRSKLLGYLHIIRRHLAFCPQPHVFRQILRYERRRIKIVYI